MQTLPYQDEKTQELPKYHYFHNKTENFGHILMPGYLATTTKNVDATKTAFLPTDSTQKDHYFVHVICTENLAKISLGSLGHTMNIYEKTVYWIGRTIRLWLYMPLIN